jgi:2-polyprenyl-6-methoxyphenol hydroxylase-like FAD-dependent oxidoreductase
VIIFERDACPTTAQPRKGVPQGQHAHALLPRGQLILEELFPGLVQQLLEQGAMRGFGRFFSGGGYFYPVRRGPGSLYVSRPLLETTVRAHVLAIPNLLLRERCNVTGLVTTDNNSRVTGIRVMDRQREDGMETIQADLVVDASGRGSRLDDWLVALGYAAPEVEIVEVGMGYATRLYRREPTHLNGDLMVNVAPTLANPRACGMMAQEGDRWIVTLAGYFGDHPLLDEAGFLAFAKRLPTPDVYELIRTATPLSEPLSYKFPSNQRRHYERLVRFPEGLLAIGDSICSFTPIYGQGMSVAAMEAVELRKCLEMGSRALGLHFFRQIAKVVDAPWSITVGNDRRLMNSGRRESLGRRVLNWYLDQVQLAARHNAEVAWAFLRVGALLDLPPSLLHPKVAWQVIHTLLLERHPTPAHAVEKEMLKA